MFLFLHISNTYVVVEYSCVKIKLATKFTNIFYKCKIFARASKKTSKPLIQNHKIASLIFDQMQGPR